MVYLGYNQKGKIMVKIEVQNFSRHWIIRVVKNNKIVRVHTGSSSNMAWQKKCLKNLEMIYGK